jgi:hypothetical protein
MGLDIWREAVQKKKKKKTPGWEGGCVQRMRGRVGGRSVEPFGCTSNLELRRNSVHVSPAGHSLTTPVSTTQATLKLHWD